MNDATLQQLKRIVEKAVRPVRVSMSRKIKMREELLQHVIGTFEQEFAKSGDEAAAILQTERRFGAPAEVTRQLQETVPGMHRLGFMNGRLFRGRPGESFVHLAARYSVWAFVCQVALQGLLALDHRTLESKTNLTLGLIGLFAACISGTMFAVLLLTDAMQKAWAARSFARLALLAPIISVVAFVPFVAFDYGSDLFLPREGGRIWRVLWESSIVLLLWIPTCLTFFIGVLAWLKAKNEAEGRRADEWEALPVE